MRIAIDGTKIVNMDEVEKHKYCAINHKGKTWSCPYCGYKNIRCKSGRKRRTHFFHNNDGDEKSIRAYENCPYYTKQNLSKNDQKHFTNVQKNIDYIYNYWYACINPLYRSHILCTNIPNKFIINNTQNFLDDMNKYIYFVSSYLEEDNFKNIINRHKTTDEIYFIFIINEKIRPYPTFDVNTNVIRAKFTGKNELPFFVDYEHNYNSNTRQNIKKYKNVKVFIDNNMDLLLEVNFNNCDNGYEVYPIDLKTIINTDFRGIIDKVPERKRWYEMYNLIIKRDEYIPPTPNELKTQGKKKCNKCNFILDLNDLPSCKNCRKKWYLSKRNN